jgi:hypothetical protein
MLRPQASAASAATWDPSFSHAEITLSEGNRRATKASSGWRSVLSTLPKSSGKWYAEVTVLGEPGACLIGVANTSADRTTYIGSTNGIGASWDARVLPDNPIECGNEFDGFYSCIAVAAFAAGDVISLQVDLTTGARFVWFARNGVYAPQPAYFGSSAGGAGLTTGDVRLAYTGHSSDCRLNAGQSAFAYSLPSGFSAWG